MSFDGAFSRRGGASEAGRKALTDESIELNPQLRDLRTALGIAFGRQGYPDVDFAVFELARGPLAVTER